jgi:hypothetical protein
VGYSNNLELAAVVVIGIGFETIESEVEIRRSVDGGFYFMHMILLEFCGGMFSLFSVSNLPAFSFYSPNIKLLV